MINEVENKVSLNQMSDLEFGKNKLEMMRYRANSLSYMLGLIGVLTSLFAAFVALNSMNPRVWVVLVKIAINIIIVLFGFLCCERAKSYNKKGSLVLVGLGAACALRIFWIPIQLILGQSAINKGELTDKVGDTVIPTSTSYTAWLPADGNFRAVLCIMFLIIAATAFIAAGVIGYIRSVKLAKYLDSIKQNN